MSDDLGGQTSYFQAEARSIRQIIRDCETCMPLNSLIIIDEIFRGTNTIERIAAAKAVLSYFIENKHFVLVSTHDLELAGLLGSDYRVFSFEELSGDDRLTFDYKLKEGLLKNKNGIAFLKGLDYPQNIIAEASKISLLLREKYDL
ncbi:DNA mismatch repair protein MutS [mine drainage metagenome]|uniref:DNA mismatch repair protein MutS n=1 Tax=mine drainage metagenome TaxID=410659 RepID=A0A1J5NW12_9ZZZZ